MVLSWHWADEANCSVVWGIPTLNLKIKGRKEKTKTYSLGDFGAHVYSLKRPSEQQK
jgi:hypothetical protein